VPLKNYYALLEVLPTAPAEDVKRAFRLQIARYHPDKVQHLGKEFQEMAAVRAAELTEAYRILSDEGRRAEYDKARAAEGDIAAPPSPKSPSASAEAAQEAAAAATTAPEGGAARRQEPKAGGQFKETRASRDEFVRKAILERFRQAFSQVAGSGYDESSARGFDVAWLPKAKLFKRKKGPRLAVKFVSRVDAAAVADAWAQAGKWNVPQGDDVCVILMATDLAPQRELADAIAEQRRRPVRGVKVTLIPVNASIWDAHMPTDAPAVAKDVLVRLRQGN
jgi:curved DNA-binding protein CbpA